MNRRQIAGIFMTAALAAVLFVPAARAQKLPYDQLMKAIQTTFASLGKNLDASAAPAVSTDAAKLEGLFGDVESFWIPFKTKDALDAAKAAREGSAAVAAAAKENDLVKAKTAYTAIGRTCGTCHSSHRDQMPDKTFRIKP
jgi:cytochrome c556